MLTPTFTDYFSQLIAESSISSTNSDWDQSNMGVVQLLCQWLTDLGFEVELMDIKNGKQNLIAKKGTGEGGLLLAGHTDTVPFDQGKWNFDPLKLTEANQRFYGLGTCDMKGFFAFILEVVKGIDWHQQQKPLYILATCDEEVSMLGARRFAQQTMIKPDGCIVGEPTKLVPIRAHKGYVANTIRVTGKTGHSSDPSQGVNAIEIMHEVLYAMMKLRDDLIKHYHHPGFAVPYPTLNMGAIHGGDSVNRICGSCELHYDVRPLPGMRVDDLENALKDALKPIEKKWPNRITVTSLGDSNPVYEIQPNHSFVKEMEGITGFKAETASYCTEAPFLHELCPTIIVGPGSIQQAHQPDEYLSLDYIKPTLRVLNDAIRRYCF